METLRRIIHQSDTAAGRWFDLSVQTLIVLSLIAFSIDTLPGLSERTIRWLDIFECVTIAIFTIEYGLRILVAERKIAFICSFFGVIDFLSIFPFFLSTGVDLRSVRAFRLLRLFRILKLVRYSKAIQRFHRALLIAKEELILYFCVTLILLYLAAVGIYYCENEAQPKIFSSVFHSLWWAVATLTTVGYGDIYPITVGGRVFTVLVLLIGLGVVAVPAGLVASALSKARELEEDDLVE